jgi:hypothetical protein
VETLAHLTRREVVQEVRHSFRFFADISLAFVQVTLQLEEVMDALERVEHIWRRDFRAAARVGLIGSKECRQNKHDVIKEPSSTPIPNLQMP